MRDWRLKHFINQCFRQLGPGIAGKFEPSILPHHLLATLFRYFQFSRHLLRLSGPGQPGQRRRAARAPNSWALSAPAGTEPSARDRSVTAPNNGARGKVGERVVSKEPSNLPKDTFAHPTIKVSAYKATNKSGNLNRAGWGWAAVDSEMKGKHKTTGPLFFGLWTQDTALVFQASSFLTKHLPSASHRVISGKT